MKNVFGSIAKETNMKFHDRNFYDFRESDVKNDKK
jgi:hypothetical protein